MVEDSIFVNDNFVAVQPGEPYRLLPFGVIVKDGKRREINRELAAKFRLPHYKPPVKLGSHKGETPAGGFIVGLEVRDDGLYAIPEWTDQGKQASERGDYRYHSPEVIWEGEFENPEGGEPIRGPMIVGDALLHAPHLGERAALFESEIKTEVDTMSETVQVPVSVWDKFLAKVFPDQPEPITPEPQAPEGVKPEEYEAAVKERDEYKAKLEALEAEAAKTARVEKFTADLKAIEIEGGEILAEMTDAQAEWVLTQFKALHEQIKESNLTGEHGSEGEGVVDGEDAQDKAIQAYAAEHKLSYINAAVKLAAEQPDLFKK